jgi:hypothetical protein
LSCCLARSSEHGAYGRPTLAIIPRGDHGIGDFVLDCSPTLERLPNATQGIGVSPVYVRGIVILESLGQGLCCVRISLVVLGMEFTLSNDRPTAFKLPCRRLDDW